MFRTFFQYISRIFFFKFQEINSIEYQAFDAVDMRFKL